MIVTRAKDKDVTVLNVYSDMNTWIDCVIFVATENAEEAIKVLDKAFDDWNEPTEEAQDECYGDWLEAELKRNGIDCEIYYKPDNGDEE